MFHPRSTVLMLGILFGTAFLGFSGRPSVAQTSAADLQPWEGGGQSEAESQVNNPLGGRGATGSSSIFELINQLQQLDGQSSAEFVRNQDKNFNSAVEDFQKRQQEAIESLPEE